MGCSFKPNRLSVGILALCVGQQVDTAVAQEPSYADAARRLVAWQVASDFAVWRQVSHERVAVDDIRLEPGPSVAAGILVLRGIPPRDHWHPYLVVVKGDVVCPAGGFASPDLNCVARLLDESRAAAERTSVARLLAVLADENGASNVFRVAAPQNAAAEQVRAAWIRVMPSNWPRDTVLVVPGGEVAVLLTVLSQQTRSYELAWRAVAYDFRFGARGQLLAWSRRVSEPFMGPGSPAR